jgi:glycosyltransferase involved in cell wall biosynthesis
VIAYLDAHVPAERRYRNESYWRALHEATMRWLGREAVLLVTPSTPVRDYYLGIGIPAAKLAVAPNAVLERHVVMGAEAARRSPPLAQPGRCTLGFAGSLSDWHRVDTLLEALAILARRWPETDYRLVVVGAGREDSRLRTAAARLGVAGRIDWRGPLSHDRAVAAMEEFDVAVLPGTLPVGAPIKLAEYAVMGRPIVAPALPNVAELLAPDLEAVLVEPGNPAALADAVEGLAQGPARARRIGAAAQARVRVATWERLARRLASAAVAGRAGEPAGARHDPDPAAGGPAPASTLAGTRRE